MSLKPLPENIILKKPSDIMKSANEISTHDHLPESQLAITFWEQKSTWQFFDSPELGAILFTFLGIFAGGSLFICFTDKPIHRKTMKL